MFDVIVENINDLIDAKMKLEKVCESHNGNLGHPPNFEYLKERVAIERRNLQESLRDAFNSQS